MRRLALLVLMISSFSPERRVESTSLDELSPKFVQASNFAVSIPVREIEPAQPESTKSSNKMGCAEELARQVPNKVPFRKERKDAVHDLEAAVARFSDRPMPAATLVFDGISSNDNAAAYGFRIVPPDTNGDVGLNHYVQAVNSLIRIFDKEGNALTPPFKLSSLFSRLGTACARRDDGDPIALYDPLADRWFFSQICALFPPFRQMIAVSKTSDPTGEYYLYEFVMPNFKSNDYPKFGIWTDAIYMTTDQFFGGDYAGTGVFAFDKVKLYSGNPTAGYIYFDLASPSTIRLGGLLPADVDGLRAPVSDSGIFVGYTATEYGDSTDAIRLFEFRADFLNPSNSSFSEMPESPLVVSAFDPTSPEGRSDILQPAPGEPLDSQSDRLMYRVAYRNFGGYDSLVFNQTIRMLPPPNQYRAGVRVYELRRDLSARNPRFFVNEQATIGDNEVSRWMGSAAQDHQGNLAIGYSYGSENKKASIVYTGKLSNEPNGVFRRESTLSSATGVQTAYGFRWGDYSQMSIDPADDCSFWYTNEYYSLESQEESPFGWLTKIGKFRFEECQDAPRGAIYGFVLNSDNNQPIEGATIKTGSYMRISTASGSYSNLVLLPGSYDLTVTAHGFKSKTVSVLIGNGQNIRQDFLLEPAASIELESAELTTESCVLNGAAEPGETVTMSVKLKNTGRKATSNLTATLLPTVGILNLPPAQNYGVIAPNETSVRSFRFTISPNLSCGASISLIFSLTDGTEQLGDISVTINAGLKRIALNERFDLYRTNGLPAGWTTSAQGSQLPWTISRSRSYSPPSSAFSACSTQIGVNELVSPVFRVNSPQAELQFDNWYELESTFLRNRLYDGAVLEIKIGEADWQDIEAAGGVFLQGGYDGIIDSCCQNPLAGRRGWSGKSGINQTPEFVLSRVRLPATAVGHDVRLRWRVGTDLGTAKEGQYIDNVVVTDGYTCECQNLSTRAVFDFDGDGRTDVSVFRPSNSDSDPDFFIRQSRNEEVLTAFWGVSGDLPANADYDGDGRTDLAVFRPSTGTWFILSSRDNTIFVRNFGIAGDRLVPADYDGDGKADIAVFRPTQGRWYILRSSDLSIMSYQFGLVGDIPVVGDYDGDGRSDIAVWRPSNGNWFMTFSSDSQLRSASFGANGDKPVPGDFDGDGKTDLAVFRPSDGTWYLMNSRVGFKSIKFGISSDRVLQADFDGDGISDVSVFRNGTWFLLRSSDSSMQAIEFGLQSDIPVPAIFTENF